jgi:hypothetical protein
MNADGSGLKQQKIAFEWDINGMKQSNPNAYAEVWIMKDGGGETSTGVQCSNAGCAPRWQLRIKLGRMEGLPAQH